VTAGRFARRHVYWLLVLPALAMMVVFYTYPLAQVLWVSLTDPSPGLGNYALLFTSPAVQRIIITTARICIITSVLTLVLGYLVAYAMVHVTETHRQWMLFCVLLTFWLSVLVRAFAWVMILRPDGPLNAALLGAGLVERPLQLVRNEIGVVIGMVHYMLPYAVLPLYANMQGIDRRLVAAARGLGASPFTAFWRVFLPLNLPGIVGAGLLVFVFSLGFYITPAILGGGRTTMIAEYIGIQIQATVRWGLATMLASSLLITVFLTLGLMSRVISLRKLFGATA
jgi:putative spermidine/putrescine transport system permease protein